MWSVIATSAGGSHSVMQAAGGVGEEQRAPAEPLERLDRDRHRARVAALVIVAAPLEQRDALALQRPHDQPPLVAGDGGLRKAGDFGVGDRDRVLGLVRQRPEAGAEHEGERRQRGQTMSGERRNGRIGVRRHAGPPWVRCSGPNECGSNSSSVKLARTPSRPGDMDRRRRVGEFADALAAAAAGRAEPFAVADDENFRDAPPPGERHRRDRAGFRAGALRIGGVLDVAAGENLALRRRGSPRRP